MLDIVRNLSIFEMFSRTVALNVPLSDGQCERESVALSWPRPGDEVLFWQAVVMTGDTRVVQSNDPRAQELTQAGYVVVGESWGARLRLSDPPDLWRQAAAVAAATAQGFTIQELDASWAPQVAALEALNYDDYPFTPATAVPRRSEADMLGLWTSGYRLFGANHDGLLVAVTVINQDAGRGETEFTSVHPSYRRIGLAIAVKGASITALAADGMRVFGTGGAQVNVGSIRMNERLGYAIEERWLSLEKPHRND